jgi:hypothetical protein
MSSTFFATTMKRLTLLTALACVLCWLAGCGGSGKNATAVKVGQHTITVGEVEHWISVLKGRGSNGNEPGPPAPVPPRYTECISYVRAHPIHPIAANPPIPRQPKAYCEFEYHRFKLKALYFLISYQWVVGEARELGVPPSGPAIARELATYRTALNLTSDASYKRYLRFTRATASDLRLSFELEQLSGAVEAKIAGATPSPAAKASTLAQFGKSYRQKWLARTDCRSEYVVPICRQWTPGRRSEFPLPSVPLTGIPGGA